MSQEKLYELGDEVINYIMEVWPVTGTHMGVHERDGKLADLQEEKIGENYQQLADYRQQVDAITKENFTLEAEIDQQLLYHNLSSMVRDYEFKENHLRNPNLYVEEVFGGIMSLLLKDFAPLRERLQSLKERLADIPRVFEQGEQNLVPARIPPVWLEVSLEQLKMAPGLFAQLLPGLVAEHLPEAEDDFRQLGQSAAAAAEEFSSYLKNDAGFKAKGEFAVGEEYFNTLLEENHLVSYNAEELLEIGEEIFAETKAAMKRQAEKIKPGHNAAKLLEEAKKDHPAAGELLSAYQQAMEETREFVIKEQIVNIPEGEELKIIETPPYLRPIIPYAAYMQPGIFADDLTGLFLVTPVDPDADAELKEEKLKGHFYAKLPITTLHEGYPGHHLQLSWAAKSGSNIRKTGSFLSTLFVEGWAFYCEELMEDLGYIADPLQKLSRLADQLWRAARIILDVKLHCQGMSVEDAIDFLVDNCQLERSNARAEVRRYTSSPTQPQSYLMGKREILNIIKDYQRRYPNKSLQEMHNEILQAGSLPPKLLRRHLELE